MNNETNLAKLIAREVAQELSMQGFLLEHEVALRGDWEQSQVDKATLNTVADKLLEQAALLRRVAR
jgi:hypothetical protein